MHNKRTFLALLIFSFLLFSIAIGIYMCQFDGGISTKQADFGAFGDYLNPFLSVVNIILLVYISLRANEISGNYNKIQLQPQLFLSCQTSPSQPTLGDECWIAKNAYEAPAINIFVSVIFDRKNNIRTKWINCFTLERNALIELLWLRLPNEIEVIWSNVNADEHYRIVYKNWRGVIEVIDKQIYYNELIPDAISATNSNFLNRAFTDFLDTNKHLSVDKLEFKDYKIFLESHKLLR